MGRPGQWIRNHELRAGPRPVLRYVLAVELLAVISAAATAGLLPVTGTDWVHLAVLAGCALIHVELSRSVERERKLAAGAGPFLDGLTPWHFAAVLVLPAPLAALLVVFTQTHGWLRVWRGRRPLYRWIFSAATVLLATQASAVLLAVAVPGPHPGIPPGWTGLAIVVAVALVRWVINYALIAVAILLSAPRMSAAKLFSGFGEQLQEAGALGLGLAAAGLLELDPRLLAGVILGLVALHRNVLLAQFRNASRTDGKTGLYTPAWWHQIATGALERASGTRAGLGVLMLDLDHFKQLNDTYGHLAGDRVLRAVADAITSSMRSYDAACRWGGEEFAVLLPEVGPAGLREVAERIRASVRGLQLDATTIDGSPARITGLTISIGGALYPGPGIAGLDDLQLAADAALYTAKNNGRDRVQIASLRGESAA